MAITTALTDSCVLNIIIYLLISNYIYSHRTISLSLYLSIFERSRILILYNCILSLSLSLSFSLLRFLFDCTIVRSLSLSFFLSFSLSFIQCFSVIRWGENTVMIGRTITTIGTTLQSTYKITSKKRGKG